MIDGFMFLKYYSSQILKFKDPLTRSPQKIDGWVIGPSLGEKQAMGGAWQSCVF